MLAPLFVKYRTSSGTPYVYDLGTGEILKVNDVVYTILDDYRILENEELVEAYSELGEEAVRGALADLDTIREQGILRNHEPTVPDRARAMYTGGKNYTVLDYHKNNRSVLVLGVTEKCNLRCDYCPYGGHYTRFRDHGDGQMPDEVAERAILEHVSQDLEQPAIAFYGGEPFLNFDLIKRLVLFGERAASERGKKVFFGITTNGTLLTDEKIHFIVNHKLGISISLDGPRDSHDRYRVFHDGTGSSKRIGSFDLIMRNIRRFVELYPQYEERGIFVTLSRPFDLEGAKELIDTLWPYFPRSRVNFVNDELGCTFEKEGIRPKQNGCVPASGCGSSQNEACGSGLTASAPSSPMSLPILSNTGGSCGSSGAASSPEMQQIRDYEAQARSRNRSVRPAPQAEEDPDGIRNYFVLEKQYVHDRARYGEQIGDESPFVNMMFREQMDRIHDRPISARPYEWYFNYKCFPGAVRLFCDIRGRYYVCERCESTEATYLGDVWSGFDPSRSERLMEQYRQIADCGNCIAQKHCSNCFTSFQQSEGAGLIGEAYDYKCQSIRKETPIMLKRYTEIMEINPDAFSSGRSRVGGEHEVLEDEVSHETKVGGFQAEKVGLEVGCEELVW
jgi:sulfatase maturation enzyme AslB (radical SAM superfamily)